MKVLLAIDGSVYTQHMLAYLAARDELLGPGHSCTALAVIAPVPSQVTHFINRAALDDYYASQANELLRPVAAFGDKAGWQMATQHLVGHAADAISKTAEAGRYDLIVMGSHGHSALGALTLGSVTTGVLARSKVPVLVVPLSRA